MKVRIILFLLIFTNLIFSCNRYTCYCDEYINNEIADTYEKSINSTQICEDLNEVKANDADTTKIICGDKNPM